MRTRELLVELMEQAVDLSIRHVETGGLPFVGVVVDDNGSVSGRGVNEVLRTRDPSAHAEIVAMRTALRARALGDLAGSWLLATGEPCGMCYRFAIDHHIERIFVAVDSDTVAERGFDYRSSYAAFNVDRSQLTAMVHRLPVARRLEPFDRFLDHTRLDAHAPSPFSTRTKGQPS